MLLCPWKSMKSMSCRWRANPWTSWKNICRAWCDWNTCFSLKTVGESCGFGWIYWRLRSEPASEHLLLPSITPSGFSIGTILKTNRWRSSAASSCAETRNCKTPCMIQLALLSPGCTRAVRTTTGLVFTINGSLEKSVMVNNSQTLPPRVRLKTFWADEVD